jgi:hypothetical protein
MSGDDGPKISKDEVFYTEGDQSLQQARLKIAKFSIERSQKRIQESKQRRS